MRVLKTSLFALYLFTLPACATTASAREDLTQAEIEFNNQLNREREAAVRLGIELPTP